MIKALLRLLILLVKALLCLLILLLTEACLNAEARVIHTVEIPVAKAHTAGVSAQSVDNLVSLRLILTVKVGITVVGTFVGKLKFNVVKVRRINADKNFKFILKLVTRRIVGNSLAVAAGAVNFAAVLLNLISYVVHL